MKNRLMSLTDKLLLRKRAIIESITDQLKNVSQIEHTRPPQSAQFLHQSGLWADCLLASAEETVLAPRFTAT